MRSLLRQKIAAKLFWGDFLCYYSVNLFGIKRPMFYDEGEERNPDVAKGNPL